MKRILLFGGSFNPPHVGHIQALRSAAEILAPERIFLIPAAEPPHKQLAEGSPSADDRLQMTRLAAAEVPGAEVLDIEIRRGGVSYTSDTLRDIHTQYPDHELVFLVGTDMFLNLVGWHEPEVVMSLSSIAYYSRGNERIEEIGPTAEMLKERYGAVIYILPGKTVELSSTEMRTMLKERKGCDQVAHGVYDYIIRNRFYGAKPDLAWLRKKAYACLKPRRVPHVQGVEQEAVRLAERWNVPPDDAAEAAICHDITKKLEREDQLLLCSRYDIIADECERASDKLMHAKTGAALARDLFGVSDEVAGAIRWHTTGRADMTDLEMITYLADYIEPNRNGFPGLSELRAACYDDLDAAMELAMRMSLDEVYGKGQEPHAYTRQGWRWYRQKLRDRGICPVHAEGIPDVI